MLLRQEEPSSGLMSLRCGALPRTCSWTCPWQSDKVLKIRTAPSIVRATSHAGRPLCARAPLVTFHFKCARAVGGARLVPHRFVQGFGAQKTRARYFGGQAVLINQIWCAGGHQGVGEEVRPIGNSGTFHGSAGLVGGRNSCGARLGLEVGLTRPWVGMRLWLRRV